MRKWRSTSGIPPVGFSPNTCLSFSHPRTSAALYSTFLRALVSSKAGQTRDGTPAPSGDHNVPTANGDGDASMQEPPESNGTHPPTGGAAPPPPPSAPHADNSSAGMNPWNNLNAFNNYSGEIGPTQVQDLSTFPPTFASPADPNEYPLFSMDNILGDGFWDSVLMPGRLKFQPVASLSADATMQVTITLSRVCPEALFMGLVAQASSRPNEILPSRLGRTARFVGSHTNSLQVNSTPHSNLELARLYEGYLLNGCSLTVFLMFHHVTFLITCFNNILAVKYTGQ